MGKRDRRRRRDDRGELPRVELEHPPPARGPARVDAVVAASRVHLARLGQRGRKP